jgi:hypothetical protein
LKSEVGTYVLDARLKTLERRSLAVVQQSDWTIIGGQEAVAKHKGAMSLEKRSKEEMYGKESESLVCPSS